jgi:hypothetical protein
VDRSDLLDAFVNFDFANPDMVNGRRYETSVPQQALFLMNSPVVIDQARKLVASDAFKSCRTDTERVEQLYQRIYQRLPTELEQQLARDFVTWDAVPTATAAAPVRVASADLTPQQRRQEMQLARRNEQAARQRDVAAKSKPAPLTVWEEYAHALLQANEFSFVN